MQYGVATLDAIEGLGFDQDSALQKYLQARRFHNYWRFTNRLPDAEVAIHSARAWFDAVAHLVKTNPRVFRRDPDIEKILADYHEPALHDSRMRARLTVYFPDAVVAAAKAQMTAVRYQIVRDIPQMIREGRYEEAKTVNNAALTAFNNATPEEQKAVTRKQGINRQVLEKNATFIATLVDQ